MTESEALIYLDRFSRPLEDLCGVLAELVEAGDRGGLQILIAAFATMAAQAGRDICRDRMLDH